MTAICLSWAADAPAKRSNTTNDRAALDRNDNSDCLNCYRMPSEGELLPLESSTQYPVLSAQFRNETMWSAAQPYSIDQKQLSAYWAPGTGSYARLSARLNDPPSFAIFSCRRVMA